MVKMKICFIAEGSYPYMIGGISSWLNIFINRFPDYEFATFAIGAKGKDKGKYLCRIPANMTHIEEIFLDTPIKIKASLVSKNFVRNENEKDILISHFSGGHSDWPGIFNFVDRIKGNKLIDFFNSNDFYEIVRSIYGRYCNNAPFSDFLWSVRTMFIYQFYVLTEDVPDADIYHCVSAGFPGIIAGKISYLRGKPFLLTEHGIYTREREEEIIKSEVIKGYAKQLWVRYFRSMTKCAYTYADKIVTQFERNRSLQLELGAERKKTIIIPNGINIREYDRAFDNRLYGEGIVVGAIARVVPIKDIIAMVDSFRMAKEKLPGIKLVVMGPTNEDESYYTYVKSYIEKSGIHDVIFTGKVDYDAYMHTLYSMDMVLLTSISEGQPLSLLEAMAFAKPVIATDVGSCGELILGPGDDIGNAGIVVRVMDTGAISEAIVHLATNEALRKKMGGAGRRRVRFFYSTEYMGKAYERLYEELAG